VALYRIAEMALDHIVAIITLDDILLTVTFDTIVASDTKQRTGYPVGLTAPLHFMVAFGGGGE
jgi:hypothetical protein